MPIAYGLLTDKWTSINRESADESDQNGSAIKELLL